MNIKSRDPHQSGGAASSAVASGGRSPTIEDRASLLQVSGITVRFGGIIALRDVDFHIAAGEVRALLGENGAGKSTLAKVLAGAIQPSAGAGSVDGHALDFRPQAAIAAGIRIITQEMSLYPPLTVAENLVTGGFGHRRRLVNWRKVRAEARRHLDSIGLAIDVDARVGDLSIAEQQMIEIGRALFSGGKIVILDEPTSALGVAEANRLFEFVERMSQEGTSFILITHFLDDVVAHAHTATVLRNGRVAGERLVSGTSKTDLVRLMVGDNDGLATVATGADTHLRAVPETPPHLVVSHCVALPRVKDMSIEVYPGEIVGLFGDIGSGSVELAEVAFGIRGADAGEINVGGSRVRSAEHSVRTLGSAYIPQDRREALALTQPAAANVTVAQLHKLFGPIVSRKREFSVTEQHLRALSVKSCRPRTMPNTLSGGNQQKLLFARCLVRPPRLMILVEPTRGMDVGAKGEVARLIRQAVSEFNAAVLVVSAEPESILAVADRIYVAQQGRIRAHLRDCAVTSTTLMAAAHEGEQEMIA